MPDEKTFDYFTQDANRQVRDNAADAVAKLWVELCQNEPYLVELLLPQALRVALGELAKATAS